MRSFAPKPPAAPPLLKAPASRPWTLGGLALVLVLISSAVLSNAAQAESAIIPGTGARNAARMDLYVVVPEILRLRSGDQNAQDISAEDIARGWVESSVQVEVTSNSRSGFQLALRTHPAWVQAAQIEGLGPLLETRDGNAFVRLTHYGHAEKQREYSLKLRVQLKPGLQPGRYAAPVAVSVSA